MLHEKQSRTRHVSFWLTPEEFELLAERWRESTCHKISDYLRKVTFHEPITTRYRNQSLDDLMAELILLRRELNAIGHNYDLVVQKLHQLQNFDCIDGWFDQHEAAWGAVNEKITAIKSSINKIDDEWLR